MEGKRTVLVIDDTLAFREYLCSVLTTAGFDVQSRPDGTAALDAAAKNDFQVIVTDYRMPNMNGVEVTKRLRLRFPGAVIIGVSTDDRREDFLAAGADAFLLKPFRNAELLNLVKTDRHGKPAREP
jgi:two-component system chemotaxis response regulator CheY